MRSNKKRNISILLALMAIALILAIGQLMQGSIAPVETTFRSDDCLTTTNASGRFIFDTGANSSLLYTDTVPEHAWLTFDAPITDIYGNKRTFQKHFLPHVGLGGIQTRLQTIITIPTKLRPEGVDGIIGTDIINRCNWMIDFSRHTLDNISTRPPQHPDLILSYSLHKNLPQTTLNIDGLQLKNIMIDTGYTRSDLYLTKKHMDMFKSLTPTGTDTCYNFMNKYEVLTLWQAANLTVNKMKFDSLSIAQSPQRNLLGLKFLQRFKQIYIDTDRQEIRCYK